MVEISVRVKGRRRNAQPLSAAGDGRIIDRLHVDVVLVEQNVADVLAKDGLADHHGNDVARIPQIGDPSIVEPPPELGNTILYAGTLRIAAF